MLDLRGMRLVALTRAGAMVAARLGPVVEDFDTVTEEFIRIKRAGEGCLSIHAPKSFGLRILSTLADIVLSAL